MGKELIRFGQDGETLLHPFALAFLLVAIVCLLVLPRRYAILPTLAAALLMPLAQQVVVAGLNLPVLRIVVLCGFIRALAAKLFTRSRNTNGGLNPIDTAVLLWGISTVVTFSVLWGTQGAFLSRAGIVLTAFWAYFLFRYLIRDVQDIDRAIRALALICAVLAIFMMVEQFTGRNSFAVFGGVHEFTVERNGILRSQGPFRHPILAGTFGATVLPLFVGLLPQGKSVLTASLGILSAIAIILASGSSTPVLASAAGLGALALWVCRRHMRTIRWGVVLGLLTLHLLMKAPVWALVARAKVVTGSTAWHRYYLFDQFIDRFHEWWLIGQKQTGHWGWEMWDTTNYYVDIGVTGGLITLVLFLAILWCSFQSLGRARKHLEHDSRAQGRVWALGSALFAHCVAFFGIVYFDQTVVAWYLLLAMISAASHVSDTAAEKTAAQPGATPTFAGAARLPT